MILTGNELRRKYLDFFKNKGHLMLPSFPLIPDNDPTLLLIGAGMAPLKPFFTGKMQPPNTRITTSQKCVRTGDIENVGRTARHQTFFEMLGNFSFGDYFKKEAISWAFEFLTKELALPAEKLWVTIHPEDDEAFQIWTEQVGFPAERIVRLEDNFWEIGPGPCGPCSEIYIDLGEERGCGSADCAIGCDCDRFLEIWNLVFTQYDRDEAGNYHPLAKKNIDTGAGLERLASVLQNKPSNFETDLLFPIIDFTSKLAHVTYGTNHKQDVSLKVIADHARSMTIMIGDGVMPSNEGRGYVLRRILRRAVRHARLLGIQELFLAQTVDIVIEQIFAEVYPDLKEKADYIKRIVEMEEKRFNETLHQGLELLQQEINSLKEQKKTVLDGQTAFKLYDTYGFPWELTEEVLAENELTLDKAAFDTAMAEQRERARAARQDQNRQMELPDLRGALNQTTHYNESQTAGKVLVLFENGQIIPEAHDGQEVGVILDETSFYAEGGGQVGDRGYLVGPLGKVEVEQTRKLPDGTIYHMGRIIEGTLLTNDTVKLERDQKRHEACQKNHTATHLLHAALKEVLGSHVNQAGSYVGPDRLRFDFSHFAGVTTEELKQIEEIVNEAIFAALPVKIEEKSLDEAKASGAMALFGEKYGDRVRVVSVADVSCELCGGSHVANSAQIGFFKILSESSVASGVRRIEAVTAQGALASVKEEEEVLAQVAATLKTRPVEVPQKVEALLSHVKQLEKELAEAQLKMAQSQLGDLLNKVEDIAGVSVLTEAVTAKDMDDLRNLADLVRNRLTEGVVLLGAAFEGKVNFVAMGQGDVVKKGFHAGKLVKEVAQVAGGGGGGRPDMAQAGGKKPEKMQEALAKAHEILKIQLNAN